MTAIWHKILSAISIAAVAAMNLLTAGCKGVGPATVTVGKDSVTLAPTPAGDLQVSLETPAFGGSVTIPLSTPATQPSTVQLATPAK